MVGNDVVDLRDPDSDAGTHPRRFDERVFSSSEQQMLRQSDVSGQRSEFAHRSGSSRLRWRLWAAKEAAFKAARKRDTATVFSPPRFEVEFSGADAGRVTHRPKCGTVECFDLRWWQTEDAVHAVAKAASAGSDAPLERSSARLIHGFRRLEAEDVAQSSSAQTTAHKSTDTSCGASWGPSRAVRSFAREQLGRALDLPSDALDIRTHGRVPVLWLGTDVAAADLSLSHHGDWIAFACWLDTDTCREVSGRRGSAGRRSRLS